MKAKIVLEDIWKSFGTKEVLRGVNLTVEEGSSMVVMGSSGAGKSVLLKIMIGLLRPDRGRVVIDGEDICCLSDRTMNTIRGKFGMSFQEGALFDSMNVFENVAFPLRRHTDLDEPDIEHRVKECLKIVNLPGIEEKNPAQLSGGMRRRVGFARAISLEPEILLFDEPTTGLDPVMTAVIANTIRRLTVNEKVTSVTITHDLAAAETIGTCIAMLNGGEIITCLDPKNFMLSENPIVRQFVQADVEGPLTEERL